MYLPDAVFGFLFPALRVLCQRDAVNLVPIRKESLKGQGLTGSIQQQIVIRFRLRSNLHIKRVIDPEIRISDIAGHAGHDIKRSVFRSGKRFDMVTPTIGMKMSREDKIHPRFVKERHSSFPTSSKVSFARFRPLIL